MKKMNLKARFYLVPKTFFTVLFNEGPDSAFRFRSDYRTIRKTLRKRLAGIVKKFSIDHPGEGYQKYLDIDRWLYESMRRFYFLGLNKTTEKKTILDLGTGAGYFPFICNYYGHRAEAIDVPDNPMYNEIVKELGIARFTQYIRAFKDLEVDKQYDLITAAMICFNNHKTPDVWHIKEWDYFLKSISRRNLKPNGQVFLSFNAETEEEPVNRELLEYFEMHDGDLINVEVFLKKEAFLTKSSEAVA
jgi:SAM-dependent methyltransferase